MERVNPEGIIEREHSAGRSRRIAGEKWEILFVFRLFHCLPALSPLLCSAAAVLAGQRQFTHRKARTRCFRQKRFWGTISFSIRILSPKAKLMQSKSFYCFPLSIFPHGASGHPSFGKAGNTCGRFGSGRGPRLSRSSVRVQPLTAHVVRYCCGEAVVDGVMALDGRLPSGVQQDRKPAAETPFAQPGQPRSTDIANATSHSSGVSKLAHIASLTAFVDTSLFKFAKLKPG